MTTTATLSLSGEFNLKLNLFNLPGGGRSLILSTDRLPLRTAEDSVTFISINANGLFNSPDNWKLLINRLAVEDIPTGFGNGRLEIGALISEEGGNIYKIHYSDKKTELSGGGSLLLSRITPLPAGRLQLNLYLCC